MPLDNAQHTTNGAEAVSVKNLTSEHELLDRFVIVLGDKLVQAVDALIADPTRDAWRDLMAELLGRSTSLSASAVLPAYDRIALLEAEVAELKARR